MKKKGEDAPKPTKCLLPKLDENGVPTKVLCNQDLLHGAGYATTGTNVRNDSVTAIAFNRLKEFGFLPQDLDTREHFFCRQGEESLKYRQPPLRSVKEGPQSNAIEVHHLITIEAVSSDQWYSLFYAMSYDINCPANCALLPGDMLSACHYGVPRHKGNHSATIGDIEAQLNYVESVVALIDPIRTKYDTGSYCKKLEKSDLLNFHNEMLNHSNTILKHIKSFTWTISSEGRDFMPGGIGCYGGHRSTEDKLNDMQNVLLDKEAGNDGFSRAAHSMEFIKDKTIHRPCTRDHSREGCLGGGTKAMLTKSMLRIVGVDAVVPDGMDYAPGSLIGCGGVKFDDNAQANKKEGVKCPHERKHIDIEKRLEEKKKKREAALKK